MAFDRDVAEDILMEFNGLVEHDFTPVGQIGIDNTAEYDSALDQLAKLGDGFQREIAWEILVEFTMLSDGGPTPVGEIGSDDSDAYKSALDQLEGCYS